jgi:uncharacterized protein
MAVEVWAGVQVDRCPGCRALWFDASELDRCLGSETPPKRRITEADFPERSLSGLSCPRCWPKSMETVGWTGIIIDRCPDCRGLFVEFGELERLRHDGMPEEPIELVVQRAMIRAGSSLLVGAGLLHLLVRVLAALLRR